MPVRDNESHRVYTVCYIFYASDWVRKMYVQANSKEEAYEKAVYERIPNAFKGETPYAAWVQSVKYKNGNRTTFNTHCGKPY